MLNMIYSGHAPEAWRLLDNVWPRGKLASGLTSAGETRQDFVRAGRMGTGDMTKDQFVREFKNRMRQSPFWPDLLLLNKGSL